MLIFPLLLFQNILKFSCSRPMMIKRAGVVPYTKDKMFILILSTKTNKWVFPKGKLKKYEQNEDAALREAKEEAGIEGEILGLVDKINDVSWYFMKVTIEHGNFDEKEFRYKRRMTYNEIIESNEVKDKVKKLLKKSLAYIN